MASSKFNPDTCQAFAEGIFDGLTIAEAAKGAGIATKTAKNWLTKGRAELKEGGGPYADFLLSIEEARRELEDRKVPMTEEELKIAVSEAAKKGSVHAQKLYWEMLKAAKREGGDTGSSAGDPFAELDEPSDVADLGAARARRGA